MAEESTTEIIAESATEEVKNFHEDANETDKIIDERVQEYDRKVDALYEEELKRPKDPQTGIIGLTQVSPVARNGRIVLLQEVLVNTTNTFTGSWPECLDLAKQELTFTRYTRDILRLVLKKGEVNSWAMSRALRNADDGLINVARLIEANYYVIELIKTGEIETSKTVARIKAGKQFDKAPEDYSYPLKDTGQLPNAVDYFLGGFFDPIKRILKRK